MLQQLYGEMVNFEWENVDIVQSQDNALFTIKYL